MEKGVLCCLRAQTQLTARTTRTSTPTASASSPRSGTDKRSRGRSDLPKIFLSPSDGPTAGSDRRFCDRRTRPRVPVGPFLGRVPELTRRSVLARRFGVGRTDSPGWRRGRSAGHRAGRAPGGAPAGGLARHPGPWSPADVSVSNGQKCSSSRSSGFPRTAGVSRRRGARRHTRARAPPARGRAVRDRVRDAPVPADVATQPGAPRGHRRHPPEECGRSAPRGRAGPPPT